MASRLSQSPSQRIEFSTFENVDVNLGSTNSIFTIFDTVTKTTINSEAGDDVVIIRKLSTETIVNLGDGNDNLNIQGGEAVFLSVAAGENAETSNDLPGGGDRLRLGATLPFDRSVINVADALNAIKLIGNGFEPGQELLFTTDGVAPAGLVSGRIYYAVPFGREVVRLASTLEKAQAASQTPSVANNPDLIQITSGGTGNHQLTSTINGKPVWPIIVGSLTGDDTNPLLSYTQPGADRPSRRRHRKPSADHACASWSRKQSTGCCLYQQQTSRRPTQRAVLLRCQCYCELVSVVSHSIWHSDNVDR